MDGFAYKHPWRSISINYNESEDSFYFFSAFYNSHRRFFFTLEPLFISLISAKTKQYNTHHCRFYDIIYAHLGERFRVVLDKRR